MNHKYPLLELDRAQFSLKCGTDMLLAIQTAIVEGTSRPEDYMDALHGVWEYLAHINDEISSCIEDCFEQRRKEKETIA